jgi:hypothetical protein
MSTSRRTLAAHALVSGCALISGCALVSGCALEWMPIEDPSPRSFVVPRLLGQCMDGFRQAADVEVIDAGQEPRSELRFVLRPEIQSELLFLPAWAWGGQIEDKRPRYEMDLSWQSHGARGQHCWQFVMRGADADPDDPPVMGVVGVGQNGAISVSTDALDDDSYIAEGELFRRLALAQPILPEQAVGVGARWRHRADGRLRGELMEIDARYELVAREGSHITLRLERMVSRSAQTIPGKKRGQHQLLDVSSERALAIIDVDLRARPFPSLRVFDDEGRETERIHAAYR